MSRIDFEQRIKELFERYGLAQKGWYWQYSDGVRTLGNCNHWQKKIKISRHLVELNDWEKVKDVVLHEIAHALVGVGHGHDRTWKSKCIELGCSPYSMCKDKLDMPKERYMHFCTKCFNMGYRSKALQNRGYTCRRCGGVIEHGLTSLMEIAYKNKKEGLEMNKEKEVKTVTKVKESKERIKLGMEIKAVGEKYLRAIMDEQKVELREAKELLSKALEDKGVWTLVMDTIKKGVKKTESMKARMVKCPRCGKVKLFADLAMNAVSRRDNKTYICSDCGTEEALIDAGMQKTNKTEQDFVKKVTKGVKK